MSSVRTRLPFSALAIIQPHNQNPWRNHTAFSREFRRSRRFSPQTTGLQSFFAQHVLPWIYPLFKMLMIETINFLRPILMPVIEMIITVKIYAWLYEVIKKSFPMLTDAIEIVLPSSVTKFKSFPKIGSISNVTFADVAGCDHVKEELVEVVDFLVNSTKYDQAGAVVPRGVLLDGPPGVGKTLLAKAVAGEAKVPFVAFSASEIIELYVGMGARRVRQLFKEAKLHSPCIIFIDEIDSIGSKRDHSSGGGGHSESEQTINQLLTEMDGFSSTTGIVVIAATNRAHRLDKALLRPGRFDRRIEVELPDRLGREAILKVHSKNKALSPTVNLTSLAAHTTGLSGASLALLMNEAAMTSVRRNHTNVTSSDVDYALDRVTIGMEKKQIMSDKKLRLTSFHEAGHALVAALCDNEDINFRKMTIIPRSGGVAGFTAMSNSDDLQDSGLYSFDYLACQLMVSFGGRVAEELVFGVEEITTGASSDLHHISDMARRMVTQYGFTAKKSRQFTPMRTVAAEIHESGGLMSQHSQEMVDAEVEALVSEAYMKCKELLVKHRDVLNEVARVLQTEETIDEDRFKDILKPFGLAL